MVQTEIFYRRFQIFVPKTFRQSSSGVEMEKFVFWESRLRHTLLSLSRDVHVNKYLKSNSPKARRFRISSKDSKCIIVKIELYFLDSLQNR